MNKRSDAWAMCRLSQWPRDQAYYIEDCQILAYIYLKPDPSAYEYIFYYIFTNFSSKLLNYFFRNFVSSKQTKTSKVSKDTRVLEACFDYLYHDARSCEFNLLFSCPNNLAIRPVLLSEKPVHLGAMVIWIIQKVNKYIICL